MAEQTLTAIPVIQAFGREEIETRRFRELTARTVVAYIRAVAAGARFKVGTTAVTALGTAAVMLIGGYHVLNHSLSLGSLLVFLAYLSAMYAPLETLAYVSTQFAAASAGGRRVLEILDAKEGVTEKPGAVEAPSGAAAGHIAMRSVSFGYRTGEPVLRDVSFEALPGEIVALVGPSGAGKSTLVSLVPRFFDAWTGSVTLGGVDVREMTLTSLRAKVSLVLQEPFLLPLSVADNIAYGRPGASLSEIMSAARAANAEEFINRLPQGYHTLLGERGVNLSGGQRQRISIARAILKNAPILILDEPTSALDAQSESLVLDALQRLMADRTTLVIAHRLSTVRRASRILVLERGAVVESGTHDELIARGGLYHKLHQLQFQNRSEK